MLWCGEVRISLSTSPLGHPAHVQKFLEKVTWKHQLLLDRIPLVQDLQCAWLILLHCAAARANFLLELWRCLSRILDVDLDQCEAGMKASAESRLTGQLGRLPPHGVFPPPRRGNSFGGAAGGRNGRFESGCCS